MSGLVINGVEVPVPGLEIINYKSGPPWCRLGPGDCRVRPTKWIRQIIGHTTKGKWPQHVIPGKGKGGRDRVVADFWNKDPDHSGAHLVVDNDGSVACLTDLALIEAYHATVSNRWSIGIETYQELDGGVYEAAQTSTVILVRALCGLFGIQYQIPKGPYRRHPLARLVNDGGPDAVGIFGHRDNTVRRGQGDPGDWLFEMLAADGAERFDFDADEDRDVWRARQASLELPVDGVPGPKTWAALKAAGYQDGVWAFGKPLQAA